MTMFDPDRMRALLRDALPHGAAQDGRPVEPRHFYAPALHLAALRPDRPVVMGIRGAGKTFWWKALQVRNARRRIQEAFPNVGIRADTIVSAGFGTESSDAYPNDLTLDWLLDSGRHSMAVWLAVLAWQTWGADDPEFRALPDWSSRVDWIASNPEVEDQGSGVSVGEVVIPRQRPRF